MHEPTAPGAAPSAAEEWTPEETFLAWLDTEGAETTLTESDAASPAPRTRRLTAEDAFLSWTPEPFDPIETSFTATPETL